MRMLLLAVGLLVGSAFSASAGGTSCWLGASVGYSTASTELNVAGLSFDGLSSKGITGSPELGCDYNISGPWVVGIMGKYTFGDVDSDIGPYSLGIDDAWQVNGRIGYQANGFMPYVLVGYGGAKTDGLADLSGGYLSELKFQGPVLGAGVEMALGPNWALKAQYDVMFLGDEQIIPGFDLAKAEPEVHSVTLGVLYRFDFAGSTAQTPLK